MEYPSRRICENLLNNRLLHLNKKKLFRHIFYHIRIRQTLSHQHLYTPYAASQLRAAMSIFHKFMLGITKDLHMNWTCSTKRDLHNKRTLFYVTAQNISSDRFDRINLSFDKCGAALTVLCVVIYLLTRALAATHNASFILSMSPKKQCSQIQDWNNLILYHLLKKI